MPLVLATTGMIGDLAERVVGASARVEVLMGPGVDPHLYKASERDVRRFNDADVILYNGLHLEGKMGEILTKMARRKPVIPVAETLPRERLLEPPDHPGQVDPHVWFDVALFAEVLGGMVEAFEALFSSSPEEVEAIRTRAESLRRELESLDEWVSQKVSSLPREQRVLITAHDAFGYFGRRYGIEVMGLQGLSTATEAGIADVTRLVGVILERKIPAVFVETSVPTRTLEAVQAACREKGHEVKIGGQLYSDAMGAAGTDAGTYFGMVRHNVETIVSSLSGSLDSHPVPTE